MINKLIEKIQKTNAPIVVGLDPMYELCSGTYSEKSLCRVWRDAGRSSRGDVAV